MPDTKGREAASITREGSEYGAGNFLSGLPFPAQLERGSQGRATRRVAVPLRGWDLGAAEQGAVAAKAHLRARSEISRTNRSDNRSPSTALGQRMICCNHLTLPLMLSLSKHVLSASKGMTSVWAAARQASDRLGELSVNKESLPVGGSIQVLIEAREKDLCSTILTA